MLINLKIAMVLLLGVPFLMGADVAPQTASAFVLGAWAGVILFAPPLMVIAVSLGLINLRQAIAPIMRVPVLIGLTLIILYVSDVQLGLGLQATGAAVLLWWARKGRHLLGV